MSSKLPFVLSQSIPSGMMSRMLVDGESYFFDIILTFDNTLKNKRGAFMRGSHRISLLKALGYY